MQKLYLLVDPVVICPYNKSHVIARSRVQKHIVKCEKGYPENYKALCPYNATHRVFKSELEEHILTCSQRKYAMQPICQDSDQKFKLYSENSSTVDCNENWDAEVNAASNVTQEDDLLDNDSDIFQDIESLQDINLSHRSLDNKDLRPPCGFSEAALKEVNESFIEDNESILSTMGMGRGKAIKKNTRLLKTIGLGRGRQN